MIWIFAPHRSCLEFTQLAFMFFLGNHLPPLLSAADVIFARPLKLLRKESKGPSINVVRTEGGGGG